jgi:hypothetical protein
MFSEALPNELLESTKKDQTAISIEFRKNYSAMYSITLHKVTKKILSTWKITYYQIPIWILQFHGLFILLCLLKMVKRRMEAISGNYSSYARVMNNNEHLQMAVEVNEVSLALGELGQETENKKKLQ